MDVIKGRVTGKNHRLREMHPRHVPAICSTVFSLMFFFITFLCPAIELSVLENCKTLSESLIIDGRIKTIQFEDYNAPNWEPPKYDMKSADSSTLFL